MDQRLPPFPPTMLRPDQRRLYDAVAAGPRARGPQHFALTRADGSLRGPFNALLLQPRLGEAVQALGSAIRFAGTLPDRSREIAILLVAAHWGSAFEREAHESVGRAAGLSDDELAALRRGDRRTVRGHGAGRRRRDDLSCWRATSTTTCGRRPRGRLGAETVFELTVLVGYYSLLALQLRVFRADESAPTIEESTVSHDES